MSKSTSLTSKLTKLLSSFHVFFPSWITWRILAKTALNTWGMRLIYPLPGCGLNYLLLSEKL